MINPGPGGYDHRVESFLDATRVRNPQVATGRVRGWGENGPRPFSSASLLSRQLRKGVDVYPGMRIRYFVPSPIRLSTRNVPPWDSTMCLAMESPGRFPRVRGTSPCRPGRTVG